MKKMSPVARARRVPKMTGSASSARSEATWQRTAEAGEGLAVARLEVRAAKSARVAAIAAEAEVQAGKKTANETVPADVIRAVDPTAETESEM